MDAEQLCIFILNKKRDLAEEKKKIGLKRTSENNFNAVNTILKENSISPEKSIDLISTSVEEKFEYITQVNNGDSSALSEEEEIFFVDNHDENLECEDRVKEPLFDIPKLLKKLTCPEIGMLRVGEYSPNNPEIAGDGRSQRGDVFIGLGLYEEKRKKLLQKRQIEYKEYLAKQNQYLKKQKPRLPPGRNLFLDDDKSTSNNGNSNRDWHKNLNTTIFRRPSSVAVQTDPEEITMLMADQKLNNTTMMPAEKELSPHSPVNDDFMQPDWKMHVEKVNIGTQNNLIVPPSLANKKYSETDGLYEPFNDISNNIFRKESPRAKLLQDLRHTYMPSLFDAESINQRNIRMEEEAASRRALYQSELKKQIEEQQKLKEERKVREKLLEEAETRRLEEQLKMLKLSKENEILKQNKIVNKMKSDANEFEKRRQLLQNEIENEKQNLRAIKMKSISEQPVTRLVRSDPNNRMHEPIHENFSKSSLTLHNTSPQKYNDEPDIGLLSYNVKRNNPYVGQDLQYQKQNYSTNLPNSSAHSKPIHVKNYRQEITKPPYSIHKPENVLSKPSQFSNSYLENAYNASKPKYEPGFLNKRLTDMIEINPSKKTTKSQPKLDDSLPIPVLREPEKRKKTPSNTNSSNSEAMINVDHKWKVPVVQKNILQNNVTDQGKQENILTQLGSIRRQLQLEQLKLDQSQFFSKQKLVK